MKKHFAVFTSLLLTATFAHSQQPNQSAPVQSGQPSSQQQSGVPSQQQPGDQFQNPSQSGVGGREGTIFNQPAGANQPQPNQFGGTNQVRFGTTNQVQFGSTNNQTFLATNQAQFEANRAFGGTNIQPGTPFNEAAGAFATNQFQGGQLTNQAGGNLADQAFAQQMRAVLSRAGAAQIFFPQTRSTISVINQNGALTLQGFVTSDEEKRAIEARIQSTPGVTSIDNQLQVGRGQNPGIAPRTPGLNPAPNSPINPEERRLLNP